MKKSILFITLLISVSSQLINAQSEIGLQLYSLREEFKKDVPATLAKIKSWGITELEGGETYGLPMEEFKKLVEQNGLKILVVGAGYSALRDNPQAAVDKAKSFGASYAVCFWIPHNGNEFGFENIKQATEVFNKAGKLFKENGISFCYHTHGYEFRPHENGTLFDYLVKNTDPQYVNFEMDVYWVKHAGQDPVALLNKYGDRFDLMHLKDRKPGTEGNENGKTDPDTVIALGTGEIGIDNVIKAARKAGVQHYFLEDESPRSVEQIPLSVAYFKNLK